MIPLPSLSAIILAGGAGSRMQGQDKGLVAWQGQPLIQHVMKRLPAAVCQRVISANRNLVTYAQWGEVVTDHNAHSPETFAGPLAGLIAGLTRCLNPWILVTPCDVPLYPTDFAERAWAALQAYPSRQIAVAQDEHRLHPLCLLVHRDQLNVLQAYFPKQRRVMDWLEQQNAIAVNGFDAACFANFNTPTDLQHRPILR